KRAAIRSPTGSWPTGKNVPENRNSGMTTMRMITGNWNSLSWVAVKAVIGAAKAAAHSPAAGTAAIAHGDETAPRAVAIKTKAAAPMLALVVVATTTPSYTSAGPTGVATIAWNV